MFGVSYASKKTFVFFVSVTFGVFKIVWMNMTQIIRFWNTNVYTNILAQLIDETSATSLFRRTLDLLIVVDKNFEVFRKEEITKRVEKMNNEVLRNLYVSKSVFKKDIRKATNTRIKVKKVQKG